MANLSNTISEEELEKLRRKIKRTYQGAYANMRAKSQEYFNALGDRLDKEWKSGQYTAEQFEEYKRAQIGRGERWNKLADDMAQRMVNANQVASAYINDKTPSIFALGHNYSAYQIEKAYGGDFTLYNEQTVKNLIEGKGNYTEFRTVSTNPVRDYEWNRELINKSLTSAILQGKDLGQMTDSFLGVMKRNRSSAERNARTAFTSAMNAGRVESFKNAKAMGINVKKQWITCEDGRVRDSHAHLDTQIRDYDKPFSNGLMYPGDSGGRPEEVYNCRCDVVAVLPDYEDEEDRSDWEEWQKQKKAEAQAKAQAQAKPQPIAGIDPNVKVDHVAGQLTPEVAKLYKEGLSNPAVAEKKETIQKFFNKYDSEATILDDQYKKTAHFSALDGGIRFNRDTINGNNYKAKCETLFHEMTHQNDYLSGGKKWLYTSNQEYNGKRLETIIKEDYVAFKKSMGARSNAVLIQKLKDEGKALKTVANASDILEYCTSTSYPLGVGHGKSYHKHYGMTEKEFMAEVVSSAITNKEGYEYLVRIFPNAVDALWAMIEGVI